MVDKNTVEQTSDHERAATEIHVKGVEDAADKGLLTRKMAERVIGAGTKANRSHDLARGVGQRGDD